MDLVPKILFLCVNFNSYDELTDYLRTINNAKKECSNTQIDVLVADNSVQSHKEIDTTEFDGINVNIFPYYKNYGYLGGISKLINDNPKIKLESYEYVIISNVDILLTDSFFSSLLNYIRAENVGWIAPKIISMKEKKDRNPKILKRLSKNQINILLFLYSNPILYNLYELLFYKLRRNKISTDYAETMEIYAGHGSFMIFTGDFIQLNRNFHFPSFLFGEEIFFGELMSMQKLKVVYVPDIVVNDIDHISTSNLKNSYYCKLNHDSLTKIKDNYYE